MQRMSDMLTRWLDGANRSSEQQEGEGNEEGERGAQEVKKLSMYVDLLNIIYIIDELP